MCFTDGDEETDNETDDDDDSAVASLRSHTDDNMEAYAYKEGRPPRNQVEAEGRKKCERNLPVLIFGKLPQWI